MTRPPSCLQCTSRHIQGGVDPRGDLFSCTRRGAARNPGRIVLGMLSVYLRSCRVHVALPLLSSVLVQLVRWLPAVEQKCLSTLRDAGGL